ncbi:MAG TPA: type 2 isopentenyl-diphosphate Delta-isomerase [Polyangiaceae bacterium]|nr:type 2 isopentenyl-diphosphate Delta-isomerase [Polyangiaceae bacterium]
MSDLGQRKTDHIELALRADVGFRRTTLLEEVELVHSSLPELSWDQLDTSLELFGKRLNAPLVIAAMTGGNDRAGELNAGLAEVAERGGYAIGLGSQRAMVKTGAIDATIATSYRLRSVAPTALVFGNIGVVQAGQMSSQFVIDMLGDVGADALCIHLNPAQELIQADGDRDFRGCLDTIARLTEELEQPVIVKETGAGLSRATALALRSRGVLHVDVSGAGGTSWTAVETHRAKDELAERGRLFWNWGIPTAASLLEVAPAEFKTVIATGGIRTGLDVARAIALGARAAGLARSVLIELDRGGVDGALGYLKRVEGELRTTMLLTGSPDLRQLARARRLLGPNLRGWLEG